MPDPIKPYIIGIKQTSGSAGQTTFSFTNARTGETKHVLSKNNEAKVNLGDTKEFPNGYQDGDLIDITGTGIKTGNTTHIVNVKIPPKIQTITMVDVSTTNAPAISI